jgi:hypothetical protein
MVFVGLFTLSQVLVLLFGCIPISKVYDVFIEAKCIDRITFWYVNAVVNLITDVAIFVMPIPLVRTLPLQILQKMVLVSVFSLGFFVTGISVIRITYLLPAAKSWDLSYQGIDCTLWSIGEVCSALVCVCVPTLRPLVRRILDGKRRSTDPERGLSPKHAGRETPPHVRKARHLADVDSDSDAGLNLSFHKAVTITTITANPQAARSAQRRYSPHPGTLIHIDQLVEARPPPPPPPRREIASKPSAGGLSAKSSSTGRTGNDTFWLAEDSDAEEEKTGPETPTGLRAPPRISVTSPIEGHAELPAVREPAELPADGRPCSKEETV